MAEKQESVGRAVVSDPNANRTNGGDSSGTGLASRPARLSKGFVQS